MKLLIYIIAGWIATLGALPEALADSLDSKAREGISHYNQEEYDQATAKFQASQLERPDNVNVTYNLANSLYRQGRYDEAVEAYKKALAEKTSPTLRQKSYYNMGNAYYRMGYMDESIDAYKKALELDSGDMDSKFNLEWVRKQQKEAHGSGRVGPRDENILKQQATSDRPNNPQDSPENPQKTLKPEGLKNEQTANHKPRNQPDSSSKSPTPPIPNPSSEEEHKAKEERAVQDALQEMTQMTPEEAERWLGSLSEDLKKIARRQMQGKMKDVFTDHDKDW